MTSFLNILTFFRHEPQSEIESNWWISFKSYRQGSPEFWLIITYFNQQREHAASCWNKFQRTVHKLSALCLGNPLLRWANSRYDRRTNWKPRIQTWYPSAFTINTRINHDNLRKIQYLKQPTLYLRRTYAQINIFTSSF